MEKTPPTTPTNVRSSNHRSTGFEPRTNPRENSATGKIFSKEKLLMEPLLQRAIATKTTTPFTDTTRKTSALPNVRQRTAGPKVAEMDHFNYEKFRSLNISDTDDESDE
jgi:hypothetical protein